MHNQKKLFVLSLAASLFFAWAPFTHAALTDDLVGYWTMDNAKVQGSVVGDSSALGCNIGDAKNNPVSIAGKIGEARSFNGSNQYIQLPAFNSIDRTMAAWVYPRSYARGSSPDWVDAIFWQTNNDVAGSFTLDIGGGSGYLRALARNVAYPGAGITCSGSSVPLNTWTHVAAVRSASSVKIYMNGQLNKTCALTTTRTSSSPLQLGGGASNGSGYYLNGSVDEAMIYSRALSDQEIAELYNRTTTLEVPAAANTNLQLERVSGYTPPEASPTFTLFNPLVISSNVKGIPAEVAAAWYSGMPSPSANCEDTDLCLSRKFPSLQGVRVAGLMATPQFSSSQMGGLQIPRIGLDLVSRSANKCGTSLVRWNYATAPNNNANPSATFKVPKNTPVQVSYTCQPSHNHIETTKTTCFLFIGSCNIADHNYIFRLADRSKINGVAGSVLRKTETKTVSGGETFTLQCGGFMPEEGVASNNGRPLLYDSGNVRRSGDWFNDHPDTYGFFNIPAPPYYQPQISLRVDACTGDNEIVRTVGSVQTCVPCAAPTPYRAGNICVSNMPPTVTLRANGAADGQGITVAPRTRVNVVAAYTPAPGDTLTATAINDDAVGNSVSCNSVTPRTTQCWTRADATKTYTFTPSTRDAGKTFVFSAQARTTAYPTYASYKTVSVTVSGSTGACPSNATQNPDGTCTCTQQYYTWTGGSCVLFCPSTMEPDGSGSCQLAVPPLPSLDDITFEALRVRSGQPSTLSWTIDGMAVGITCMISPMPASGQVVWNSQAVWSGSAQTPVITQPTQYTLRCENGRDTPVSKNVVVQIIPSFEEI